MGAPKLLCNTKGMSRERWLECRAHGPGDDIEYTLGGSDVSVVLGENPWTAPLELYRIKKGLMQPDDSANANQKEMGILMEPIVAHWYGKLTGNAVFEDYGLYQHADKPYALANLDYGFPGPLRKEGRMDVFHMADIIPLLPLPYPASGRSSYYVPCPKCDGRGRRNDKHLNINLAKDVFRCPKCGWNGGIFDLYAYYAGVPRENAREELTRRLMGKNQAPARSPRPMIPKPQEPALSPAADIEIRHAAYGALLALLSLAPDHERNLLNRGLTPAAISALGYRTTPVAGGRALAGRILDGRRGLSGVPGFYRDSEGQWAFVLGQRGILIPVRDVSGRIQGLQIRRDDAEKRKYRWVSSAEIENGTGGCGAEGWVHIAGPVRERVLLTEGPMKADIVHYLTGQTVVAVPGVNALQHLESALAGLMDSGVKRVMTAFDMDFLKNPHVQNGYESLAALLSRMGLRYGTYLWQPEYNGLDDYIWQFCMNGGHNES
jgi:hypothetical protein